MSYRANAVAAALILALASSLVVLTGCPRPPANETSGPVTTSEPKGAVAPTTSAGGDEVVVLAAASMSEALTALEPYAEKETGAKVTISFGGSQALRTSIEQGNRADVFISANREHMEALKQAGLAEDDFDFAHNSMALVVPKGNPAGIETLADLGAKDMRLVIALEDCPAGKYSRKLLAACDKDPAFGAGFSTRVLAKVASEDGDVKQVLSKVTLGAADAGFVYDSDITPEAAGQVELIPIPDSVQQVVTYVVGIPKTAKNASGGRRFVEAMLSEGGRRAMSEAAKLQFLESTKPPWMGS
jgi:molybdate transport system substrate-binding protein